MRTHSLVARSAALDVPTTTNKTNSTTCGRSNQRGMKAILSSRRVEKQYARSNPLLQTFVHALPRRSAARTFLQNRNTYDPMRATVTGIIRSQRPAQSQRAAAHACPGRRARRVVAGDSPDDRPADPGAH